MSSQTNSRFTVTNNHGSDVRCNVSDVMSYDIQGTGRKSFDWPRLQSSGNAFDDT